MPFFRIRGPNGAWVSNSSQLSLAPVNPSGKKCRSNRRNRLSYDSLIAPEEGQELEDEHIRGQGFFLPEAKDCPKVRRG